MSDATHTPRALLAERFGEEIVPLDLEDQSTDDGGRRARFIATLHALIAWLVAHPDVPAPWSCSIGINVPDVEALRPLLALEGATYARPGPGEDEPHALVIFRPVGGTEFYTPISIGVEDPERAARPL